MAAMDFSESSATWDDDPTRVDRAARVARAIRSALALDHPRTLEIGCGTGLLARALADQLGPVTLIDSAPGMVEVAAEQARAAGHEDWTATLVSLGTDELPAGPFGLAISQLALHHVHDVPAALSQIYQVLGTGG
ncbi:MAG: methyltransferase, partial [Micrococcales bacterium]